MLKLSIVIPTLKEEGYIEGTIKQFEHLSIPHEIIVSDGGSDDKTVEIAKRYTEKVIVNNDGMPTPAKQRNSGAALATGEFLCFTDSSVRIPDIQQFFERAFAKFDADQELVAITGPQNIFPEIETFWDKFFLGIQNLLIRIQNNILPIGAGTGKFMLMNRASFIEIQGFNEKLVAGEDLNLYLKLRRVGRTRYCPDQAILYPGRREHGLGWPKLLWIWTTNVLWIWIFGHTWIKEWNPVR
jgi:glycosyltransferase involved in cell wall biosynthesis